MGGVQRAIARLRPSRRSRSLTARRLQRRAVSATRQIVDLVVPVPTRRPQRTAVVTPRHLASRGDVLVAAARPDDQRLVRRVASRHAGFRGGSRLRLQRRLLKVGLRSERALPMLVALVVIAAGVVSLGPNIVQPVGAAQGKAQPVRLAVGGGDTSSAIGNIDEGPTLDPSADGLTAYLGDGTFYKPVAVNTQVESGSGLLQHYTVKSGDTLTSIASQFGVSTMTVWWANHFKSKNDFHQGEELVIPPVNGLIVTVKVGDTIDSLAALYKVDTQSIIQLNSLTDPTLVVGQVLILPGAKGEPISTPKPTTKPKTSSSGGTGGTRVYPTTSGTWAWPVVGGGNYISQYFHYGHYGIDIAAKYGTPVVAARGGTVVFAGWKSNGGGYQVWINNGNNIYEMSCHMSSVTVHSGQAVVKGQQVGRIGMTGDATGTHDHFAISIGLPWSSGAYFVNPLNYL
jgi:murein DD-endopeptidase MepM/ murein hydrolase activator NlpD